MGPYALTPNVVELIPTLGALFHEADPSRTRSSHAAAILARHRSMSFSV